MVRISDARMSGTAYGTVVLHTAPEAAAGGPLALVHERRPDRARRRQAQAAPARQRRGAGEAPRKAGSRPSRRCRAATGSSTSTTCNQADEGADLDFLVGSSGRTCRGTTTDGAVPDHRLRLPRYRPRARVVPRRRRRTHDAQCRSEDDVIEAAARLPRRCLSQYAPVNANGVRGAAEVRIVEPLRRRLRHDRHRRMRAATASGSPIRPTTASARSRPTRLRWRWRSCATSRIYDRDVRAGKWHYTTGGTIRRAIRPHARHSRARPHRQTDGAHRARLFSHA